MNLNKDKWLKIKKELNLNRNSKEKLNLWKLKAKKNSKLFNKLLKLMNKKLKKRKRFII